MMGFNMPVGQYTPEMLVEMAKSAFRPPGAAGMGGGSPQGAPGFNMGQGLAGLGGLAKGVGGLMSGVSDAGPQGSGAGGVYTPADAMGMANAAGLGGNGLSGIDSEIANWSAYGAGAAGMPTGAVQGLDPLTGLINWVGRQFRPGGP